MNHLLTNIGVWSPDGEWIVYDTRSDPSGTSFDSSTIERLHIATNRREILYLAPTGCHVGVVTHHPHDERIIFIHGPENPTPDWSYSACHRRGVILQNGAITTVDACDMTPPFTPGALRGGSHVHTFDARGEWIAFTYEDHILTQFRLNNDHDLNQRNIGVAVPVLGVQVPKCHPRNHDGSHFSVLITRTVNRPTPGSDEIQRACEEGWIGETHALAFQGEVITESGEAIREVFIVTLPEDLTIPGDGPLQGTATRRPAPPNGVEQRRLTFTQHRRHPGIQGVRHWLRSSPDGERIAFLMRDDRGTVQLATVSPQGGSVSMVTDNGHDIASAFSWSPDGRWIAHAMDGCICRTDMATGRTHRLTASERVRPEACVYSPQGDRIAYLRETADGNQIAVVRVE